MTEFYFLPNVEHFWHWPTLIHFFLVALAGGAALVTAIATLAGHPRARTYAFVTLILIVLDLFTLWIESPARFRLTHIWLFLTFNPQAPIWLGGWGLAISAASTFLLWLRLGPGRVWGTLLLLASIPALIYPGLALAININRPLWTPVLLVFFPVTTMVIVLGLALVARQRWAATYLVWLSIASAALGVLYLGGLALGTTEARTALTYFWEHGGLLFVLGLAFLLAGPALIRRMPLVAGLMPVVGAVLTRSLLVDIGQLQGIGF